jgi:hypothetical protein
MAETYGDPAAARLYYSRVEPEDNPALASQSPFELVRRRLAALDAAEQTEKEP